MSDDSIDRTQLTFSQAEGYGAIPTRLEPGILDKRVRALLWDYVYSYLKGTSSRSDGLYMHLGRPWENILKSFHVTIRHEPADLFSSRLDGHVESLRGLFFDAEYWQVLEFLQHTMRCLGIQSDFCSKIKAILEQSLTAYTVIAEGPTIMPTSSTEEKQSLERAFVDLKGDKFSGARTHLIRSCEALNNGSSADSIRESIHAVEAIAKVLDNNASKTLDPALKALSAKANIHTALQQGFGKIYGYTNDEQGIRHALLDGEANVDAIDATFMLGACASFISYLINKSRKVGLV